MIKIKFLLPRVACCSSFSEMPSSSHLTPHTSTHSHSTVPLKAEIKKEVEGGGKKTEKEINILTEGNI